MKLSVVIPARDEESCIAGTLNALAAVLSEHAMPYEIILVDDGSRDDTVHIVSSVAAVRDNVRLVENPGPHGFGLAVRYGISHATGDAIAIFMADASDDPADLVTYYGKLQEGFDCVFGSRFVRGGSVIDYPGHKLILNRLANWFIKFIFRIDFNDTTNAFKCYRREAIDGMQPLISPHFNLTVEMPLKAIIRGFSYAVVPIKWTNRATGVSKLKIKEMGSRYLFIVLYLWLEKHLSRGDYRRRVTERDSKGESHV